MNVSVSAVVGSGGCRFNGFTPGGINEIVANECAGDLAETVPPFSNPSSENPIDKVTAADTTLALRFKIRAWFLPASETMALVDADVIAEMIDTSSGAGMEKSSWPKAQGRNEKERRDVGRSQHRRPNPARRQRPSSQELLSRW